jgi:hypothetical protein
LWKSINTEVGLVDNHGTVTTKNEGVTTVVASDVRNKNHFAKAQVYVLPPNDLRFIPSSVEAQIDSELTLPLQLTVKLPITFQVDFAQLGIFIVLTYINWHSFATSFLQVVPVTDCHGLPFVFSTGDGSIFEHMPEKDLDGDDLKQACLGVGIKASGNQVRQILRIKKIRWVSSSNRARASRPFVNLSVLPASEDIGGSRSIDF